MIRNKKILFINILDIWLDEDSFVNRKEKIKTLHTNRILEKKDFDFRIIQKTFLLDISKSEEELMAGFEQKSCRYPIGKAKRDGVKVWKAVEDIDRDKYISFQNDFCKAKNIPFVDKSELSNLHIYCAESAEGEFLGGCAFVESIKEETVRYKYGATAHKLNANEAILWKAICDFKKEGYKYLDLGGCVPTKDRTSYYYRHFHFKEKWGGELIDTFTYFRIQGIYKLFFYIFNLFVKIFFKGDVNGFVVWLNERKMIH